MAAPNTKPRHIPKPILSKAAPKATKKNTSLCQYNSQVIFL